MKNFLVALTAWCVLVSAPAWAAEYRVEVLPEGPPADALSDEVAAEMAETGLRVVRGEDRTVCEFWLCKEWPVKSFETPFDIIYPFQPGQLAGVLRFPRRTGDFRDQQIPAGVYTLRYSQQPVDGAHVGTSPTRDFLVLLPADQDTSPEVMGYRKLVDLSSEAAQAAHPALLSLKQAVGEEEPPAMRHEQQHDWWIVRFQGRARANDQTKDLTVDMVVVGYAEE